MPSLRCVWVPSNMPKRTVTIVSSVGSTRLSEEAVPLAPTAPKSDLHHIILVTANHSVRLG